MPLEVRRHSRLCSECARHQRLEDHRHQQRQRHRKHQVIPRLQIGVVRQKGPISEDPQQQRHHQRIAAASRFATSRTSDPATATSASTNSVSPIQAASRSYRLQHRQNVPSVIPVYAFALNR